MTSALWDPIFGRSHVTPSTDDQAWLAALCAVEAALARACADVGLIEPAVARRVADVCTAQAGTDPTALGAAAQADGNPVRPLVQELRAAVRPDDTWAVHFGATSQDVLDTAAMLVARDALAVIASALQSAADSCARLAAEHRDTAMVARTLLQQAVPTTFGTLAAGWGEGLDRAGQKLDAVQLAVQLGGGAGTLAGWYPHGPAVRSAFAAELGLTDPGTSWHTERGRIADLACALGVACGAVAKVSTDIVLLAQTEVGEVREGAGGESSTMAHKHNPIAAVTARAAAAQAPGLVATVLAAMPAELQRGAGPWHAEWPALTALLNTTGGAARRLADSLTDLQVDADAMVRNLRTLTGLAEPDLGHAGDIVDHFLKGRA
jgi:3-carboxy-cis,cis-muconate cycloisomerase